MKLRKYIAGDCKTLAEIFWRTVHEINAKDYTKAQLDVWAAKDMDLDAWNRSFLKNFTVVAEDGGAIIGFGDMDSSGYVDRLFIHHAYQGQGVATAILSKLEQNADKVGITSLRTNSSITAKGFFQKRGYREICENTVIRSGISLTNFTMEKTLSK